MKLNLPPVVTQALLLGAAAIIQYLLDNFGLLNISPQYAPFVTLGGAAILKMIQELLSNKPEPVAQARAMGAPEKPAGYWQRVLLG